MYSNLCLLMFLSLIFFPCLFRKLSAHDHAIRQEILQYPADLGAMSHRHRAPRQESAWIPLSWKIFDYDTAHPEKPRGTVRRVLRSPPNAGDPCTRNGKSIHPIQRACHGLGQGGTQGRPHQRAVGQDITQGPVSRDRFDTAY